MLGADNIRQLEEEQEKAAELSWCADVESAILDQQLINAPMSCLLKSFSALW
jgi:hypothetical protein